MNDFFSVHAIFPNFYGERWVSHTLKSIVAGMDSPGVSTHIYAVGKEKRITYKKVTTYLPRFLMRFSSYLVGKTTEEQSNAIVRRYHSKMKAGDVVYFWLGNYQESNQLLKKKRVMIVREMINCTLAVRKAELTKAYALMGEVAPEITEADIENERQQVLAADMVFCPNDEVLASVIAYGVPASRCFKTSYGWEPERFLGKSVITPKVEGLNVIFAGTGDVRKGLPVLLEAWDLANIKGRLILAGVIEPIVREKYSKILERLDVKELGYVTDLGSAYRSADVFCFLSWEEGGPMVTIEALGCGLPCLVTKMGGAGIVEHLKTGYIVNSGDVKAVADALATFANDQSLVEEMAKNAIAVAQEYTWEKVALKRRNALIEMREKYLLSNQ
jgi:glycosyltransferase involved in cell wall biosynthesis